MISAKILLNKKITQPILGFHTETTTESSKCYKNKSTPRNSPMSDPKTTPFVSVTFDLRRTTDVLGTVGSVLRPKYTVVDRMDLVRLNFCKQGQVP